MEVRMASRERPSREQQIAFMMEAQARMSARLQQWTADEEVKAALHRYDQGHDMDRPIKRAVGCR